MMLKRHKKIQHNIDYVVNILQRDYTSIQLSFQYHFIISVKNSFLKQTFIVSDLMSCHPFDFINCHKTALFFGNGELLVCRPFSRAA